MHPAPSHIASERDRGAVRLRVHGTGRHRGRDSVSTKVQPEGDEAVITYLDALADVELTSTADEDAVAKDHRRAGCPVVGVIEEDIRLQPCSLDRAGSDAAR